MTPPLETPLAPFTSTLPRRVIGWVSDTDRKAIGIRYVVTAFAILLLDGATAMLRGHASLLAMDGPAMLLRFAVAVTQGAALYLVPLQLGARSLAFPRLAACGYWLYLISAARGGSHVTLAELAALVVAVNLIATALTQRAPGVTLTRMPMFVWAMLVASVMVVFSAPVVWLSAQHAASVAQLDLYLVMIPALGYVSPILVTFTRTQLVGYTAGVVALVTTGVVAFAAWLGDSGVMAASVLVAIPLAAQIALWIVTMVRGRTRLATPMWFVVAYIATFLIGGLACVVVAAVPLDSQARATLLLAASYHYVVIGGVVFLSFAGLYYWFPTMTDRRLSEGLGLFSCLLVFAGFHVAVFPAAILGVVGAARRVAASDDTRGIAALGALAVAIGVFLTLANIVLRLRGHLRRRSRGVRTSEREDRLSNRSYFRDASSRRNSA